jgi:hypothetical protein
MFTRQSVTIHRNPCCVVPVEETFLAKDFYYYDKDGFELNRAERKYYSLMNYPITYPILNHVCWQEPWYVLDKDADTKLIIDHAMILHRATYGGSARRQLFDLRKAYPQASLLIQTKQKWGFDFALDTVDRHGNVVEVLHVEYDCDNYVKFLEQLASFDQIVRSTDWEDAAVRILNNSKEWRNLQGFEQNNWKANYLLGWSKAESIIKVA